MSRRREQLERAYEREEKSLDKRLDRGDITPEQYNKEMRELEREAQAEAREAMWEDMQDARDDWNW